MKSFFEKNCGARPIDYDPVERRKGAALLGTNAAPAQVAAPKK